MLERLTSLPLSAHDERIITSAVVTSGEKSDTKYQGRGKNKNLFGNNQINGTYGSGGVPGNGGIQAIGEGALQNRS